MAPADGPKPEQASKSGPQILVLASQTVVGAHITSRLDELHRHQADGIGVHMVMPARPQRLSDGGTELLGLEHAEQQLATAAQMIERTGATVTAEISTADPMRAAAHAMRRQRFDRIIVSTLPPRASRWLAMDLPHRLRRRYKIPVDHVIGRPPAESLPSRPIDGVLQVLLVEDEPGDAALARHALRETDVEAELTVATSGSEAMEILRAYGPRSTHMVLLDLKMPVMGGHEFLERAGREFDLDRLTIVVLTNSTDEVDRERAHALGAGAYIIKDPDYDRFRDALVSVVHEVALGE